MVGKSANSACFLVSLQRILVFIRSQIKISFNEHLITIINNYLLELNNDYEINFLIFKGRILNLVEKENDFRDFFHGALELERSNFDTDNMDEINRYLPVIRDAVLELERCLKKSNYDRAYDLVDAIHGLPEAILNKKKWKARKYWKIYIKPYREKWDNDFLKGREKELFKKGIWDYINKF